MSKHVWSVLHGDGLELGAASARALLKTVAIARPRRCLQIRERVVRFCMFILLLYASLVFQRSNTELGDS
jgi:hypothetical protein